MNQVLSINTGYAVLDNMQALAILFPVVPGIESVRARPILKGKVGSPWIITMVTKGGNVVFDKLPENVNDILNHGRSKLLLVGVDVFSSIACEIELPNPVNESVNHVVDRATIRNIKGYFEFLRDASCEEMIVAELSGGFGISFLESYIAKLADLLARTSPAITIGVSRREGFSTSPYAGSIIESSIAKSGTVNPSKELFSALNFMAQCTFEQVVPRHKGPLDLAGAAVALTGADGRLIVAAKALFKNSYADAYAILFCARRSPEFGIAIAKIALRHREDNGDFSQFSLLENSCDSRSGIEFVATQVIHGRLIGAPNERISTIALRSAAKALEAWLIRHKVPAGRASTVQSMIMSSLPA